MSKPVNTKFFKIIPFNKHLVCYMRRAPYLSMLLLLVLVSTALASEINSCQASHLSKSTVVVNQNARAVTLHPLGVDFIITVIVLIILESVITVGAIWWYFKRKKLLPPPLEIKTRQEKQGTNDPTRTRKNSRKRTLDKPKAQNSEPSPCP